MAIPLITNPNVSIKKIKFDGLQEMVESSLSAFALNGEMRCGYSVEKEKNLFYDTQKLYKIKGGFLAFTSDGKFAKIIDGKVEEIKGLLLDKPPKILYLNYLGEERLTAIIKDRCLFLDGDREYLKMFEGKNYIQVGVNLFAIYKNGIVFARLNDYLKTQNDNLISYVGLVNGGELLELTGVKGGLLAFTERVIYSLKQADSESDYILSEVYSHHCKILKNSIKKVDEEIYFADEKGGVYCLENSSVKRVMQLKEGPIKIKGAFSHYGNLIYHLGEKAIYLNLQDKGWYELQTLGMDFIDGEHLFFRQENALCKLKKSVGSVRTGEIYLGKNARLERIKFNASGLTTLQVYGRFGSKKIYAGKGYVDIKVNLYSDKFAFEFKFNEDGEVKDFEIEYS